MEKKTECEIVQDLLLGYVDETLNEESKKLVDKHLSKCDFCREKLKQIREDINENQNSQKREIDYLKRIRRKTKIKSFLLAITIIILIAIICYFYNFIKINNIMNRSQITLQSENFYKETTDFLTNNQTSVQKLYYKEGKYKSVWEIYSDSGVETKTIQYGQINSDEIIYLYESKNKAVIEKGNLSKYKNSIAFIKHVPFVIGRTSLLTKLGTTFIYSIDTDTYDYGKEYYVLKDRQEENRWEIWIDSETGLPIKEINRGGTKSYFEGTDVVKEIRDNIQEYKYKFDIVTDEDINIPDLSNYVVENKETNINDII